MQCKFVNKQDSKCACGKNCDVAVYLPRLQPPLRI